MLIVTINASANTGCKTYLFPPFPPSPPPFKAVPSASQVGGQVRLSWERVPHSDGYFIALCRQPNTSFEVIADEYKGEVFNLSSLPESGDYVFEIRAYIEVDGNFVFNPSTTVSISYLKPEIDLAREDLLSDSTKEKGVPVSENLQGESTKVQNYAEVIQLAGTHPRYVAGRAFYSSRYPSVINPLVPATLESGETLPPLVTDAGMEISVERVNRQEREFQSSIIRSHSSHSKQAKSPEAVSPTENSVQGVKLLKTDNVVNSSKEPPLQISRVVTRGQEVESVSGELVAKTERESKEEESESGGSDLSIYVLVGFLIIAFIYLVFYREAK